MKCIIQIFTLTVMLTVIGCAPNNDLLDSGGNATLETGIPINAALDPVTPETALAIQEHLEKLLIAHDTVPGMVVAVHSNTYGTFLGSVGTTEPEGDTPLETDATFGIGSVHKNFKWVLMHLLAQEGKIDLDEPVNGYIENPIFPDGILIKHLMQHTAALPDYPDLPGLNTELAANLRVEYTYEKMIDILNDYSGTYVSQWQLYQGQLRGFETGADVHYSSFGPLFGLRIAETATHTNYRDMIKERIFERLGMESAGFLGYDPDPSTFTPGFWSVRPIVQSAIVDQGTSMSFSSANGGTIFCNANDLATYGHAQFTDDDFLKLPIRRRMREDAINGQGRMFGLGIFEDLYAGSRYSWWGHTGFGTRGHASGMFHNPDSETTVVVLTNKSDFAGYLLHHQVADGVLHILEQQ